jgi:predicted dithiol-disulfide oxidoreductase (DUF899 family)
LAKQRQELPWLPLEKEYTFDTEEGTAYYNQLLDQVPNGRDADFPLRRHDEY